MNNQKIDVIYPENVENNIKVLQKLLIEFKRQFVKGTLNQEDFDFYKKICNDSMIKTQELAHSYSLMIKKVEK